MSAVLVASTSAAGASGGTTGAVDTTGANFLIVHVSGLVSGNPSDSNLNTWHTAVNRIVGGVSSCIFYAYNATAGSGHTFTYGGTVTSFEVMAFSGVDFSADPLITTSSATGSGITSIQPGTVGSTDPMLCISGLTYVQTSTISIDSGFVITDQFALSPGVYYGGAAAYLVQSAAGNENPTWSWTGVDSPMTTIAGFKLAAAGGGNPWNYYAQQRQRLGDQVSRWWNRRGLLWTPSYAFQS